MMKLAVLATLAGSAAAFTSSPVSQTSRTALNAYDVFKEVGAQPPLGFFDPLGLCYDVEKEEFDRLRWVEVKHGRISMLAVVGYLVTYAGVRFPGAEDIPAGFAAWGAMPMYIYPQMAATGLLMEAVNTDQWEWGVMGNLKGESPAEFRGDFRNGFLDFGWDKLAPETKLKKRAIELNNGRAAMMGILGLMVHEKLGNIDLILPGGGI